LNASRNFFWILSPFILFGSACAETTPAIDGPLHALGHRVQLINNATNLIAAQLKVVSVNEAQSNALKDNTRIAGYPIDGKPITLSQSDATLIKQIVLNDKDYSIPLIRCANKTFYGIRFIADKEKIEFALGKPCNQIIWAYQGINGPEQWGGVINAQQADKIIAIIKGMQ
jgi:hypothetical protein